jgi:hypothetical protein
MESVMAYKATLSPLEKKEHFAKAFETYKHCLEAQNHIGAYVIAFSILEDRINALYITRYIIIYGVYPSEKIVHETGFSKKVRYLHKYGDIDKVEQDDWLLRAIERNTKLHAAMWNIDEFKPEDAASLVACARKADSLRAMQKRKYGK